MNDTISEQSSGLKQHFTHRVLIHSYAFLGTITATQGITESAVMLSSEHGEGSETQQTWSGTTSLTSSRADF